MAFRQIIGTRWVGSCNIKTVQHGLHRYITGYQRLMWLLECGHTHTIDAGDRKAGIQVAKRKDCRDCDRGNIND